MRVVVIGATGNLGTSLLAALAAEPAVDTVLGIARRMPSVHLPKVAWAAADISRDPFAHLLHGADAAVHLAWAIQPSRDAAELWRINVTGSERVLQAVAEARVPALAVASSVGAYSPGPKDRRVDERWPTGGIPTSFYSRHKAELERRLDRFEHEHPQCRVVRMRPGLLFKREAATGIRRLFAGPLLPGSLVRPERLPVVPDIPGLRFQALHTSDAADAFRRALVVPEARGAFNLAAEPVLDPEQLAHALGARRVPLGRGVARAGVALSWELHLQPTPPGWLDLALGVPLMDTTRARQELGWTPRHTSVEALRELLRGLADGAGAPTPPLAPRGRSAVSGSA